MTRQADQDRAEAIARLRELIHPGDTVYTILRHVSSSGMSRRISVVHIDKETGEPWEFDYLAACATGRRVSDRGGIVCGGAGMDMGFDLVYSLSRALFSDGFYCIGEGDGSYRTSCPSNDHSNDRGTRDYSPTRHHRDGGYALRHRWM